MAKELQAIESLSPTSTLRSTSSWLAMLTVATSVTPRGLITRTARESSSVLVIANLPPWIVAAVPWVAR